MQMRLPFFAFMKFNIKERLSEMTGSLQRSKSAALQATPFPNNTNL